MCREKRMLVMVEGRKPYCWSCGASRHMSKACSAKSSQPPSRPTATTTTTITAIVSVASTEKAPRQWLEGGEGAENNKSVLSPKAGYGATEKAAGGAARSRKPGKAIAEAGKGGPKGKQQQQHQQKE